MAMDALVAYLDPARLQVSVGAAGAKSPALQGSVVGLYGFVRRGLSSCCEIEVNAIGLPEGHG